MPATVGVHGRPAIAAIGQGHFPVVVLPGGEIVAAIPAGVRHIGPRGRLDLVRSCDGGHTWSSPTTIIDSEADDRNLVLICSPDELTVSQSDTVHPELV
jgi:hypothetical protein